MVGRTKKVTLASHIVVCFLFSNECSLSLTLTKNLPKPDQTLTTEATVKNIFETVICRFLMNWLINLFCALGQWTFSKQKTQQLLSLRSGAWISVWLLKLTFPGEIKVEIIARYCCPIFYSTLSIEFRNHCTLQKMSLLSIYYTGNTLLSNSAKFPDPCGCALL